MLHLCDGLLLTSRSRTIRRSARMQMQWRRPRYESAARDWTLEKLEILVHTAEATTSRTSRRGPPLPHRAPHSHTPTEVPVSERYLGADSSCRACHVSGRASAGGVSEFPSKLAHISGDCRAQGGRATNDSLIAKIWKINERSTPRGIIGPQRPCQHKARVRVPPWTCATSDSPSLSLP